MTARVGRLVDRTIVAALDLCRRFNAAAPAGGASNGAPGNQFNAIARNA